ncbi:fungal-specific transcription factor domain-containing protein [Flagelloscypha sp. PMI_526]|nr:fungal-specific transcription factor domain-containing protein [Flagelloscypha sp. PMI_526]
MTGQLSPSFSSSRSNSPSTPPTSAYSSPTTKTAALGVMEALQDEPESSGSHTNTPHRVSIDLPRNLASTKGGCWTCRLRRKKCDEQRDSEHDACRTCKRLSIECLGWGSKRPDWMRDKRKVEEHKAKIKAQLIRAGLVRGQPRSIMLQQGTAAPTQSRRPSPKRPNPIHRNSLPAPLPDVPGLGLESEAAVSFDNFGLGLGSAHSLPSAGPSSQTTPSPYPNLNLAGASFSDPNINTFDFSAAFPFDNYSPGSNHSPSLAMDQTMLDFSSVGAVDQQYDFEMPATSPSPASTASLQERCVMYYFEHVRQAQFVFAGNAVTNVTYNLIVNDPRGPVTNAICALASLHYHRMQVSRGLEEPNTNPQTTNAHYFHSEAWYQLLTSKSMRAHTESDAIAALHLVSFSQMSGGVTDWVQMFTMACDWLTSTGLPNEENPRNTYSNMSDSGQLAVKMILWIDIFASPAAMRTPRFASLYQRLFDSRGNPWSGIPGSDLEFPQFSSVGMDSLSGCPDDAMMGFIDVSTLAFWKATQRRKGILSLRELIRRGDAIEERLQQHHMEFPAQAEDVPLHPNLASTMNTAEGSLPNEEMRVTIRKIFRETVSLYLQVVVNDANPGVTEIRNCVNNIVHLFDQLPTSIADRALVLPICLAGCMAEDSRQRDTFKGRLERQDECIGNVMKTRLVMEAVWQKRDINGGTVDWRDVLQEREYNLLLI